MNKSVPFFNEIISLAVMLLMAAALAAGEADATIHKTALQAAAAKERLPEKANVPFTTTINAEVDGQPLTISINAVAELNLEAVRHH